MDTVKGIFFIGVMLLVINWIFGMAVTFSVIVLAVIAWFVVEYISLQKFEKKRAEAEAERQATIKAREEKLAAMKPHERKNFLKQEEENERKRLEHNARAMAEIEAKNKRRKERELARREQDLRERELAVREKAVQEAEKGKKVPLSAKVATSAVVGYKLGKHIGKW